MGGPSASTANAQSGLASTESQYLSQLMGQSAQSYATGSSAINSALSYYNLLASGNPNAIFTATAPAAENIAAQKQSAINTIQNTVPRGGTQNLDIAQADVAAQTGIGQLFNQAYTSSFPALANLGTTLMGLSTGEANAGTSAASTASSTLSSLGSEQSMGKASTLGFLGSLGGAAAMGAGTALG